MLKLVIFQLCNYLQNIYKIFELKNPKMKRLFPSNEAIWSSKFNNLNNSVAILYISHDDHKKTKSILTILHTILL